MLFHCGHLDRNEILLRVINEFCKHCAEMKSPDICACEHFITTKMVENMIIACLFKKTAEKTTSGIMSFSEEDAVQRKRIIEKRRLGIR